MVQAWSPQLKKGQNTRIAAIAAKRQTKEERRNQCQMRAHMVVIFIFLACNTPRFVLNFEECMAGRDYTAAAKTGCNLHPFCALVLYHISQLLICVNSSLGFVIYCVMSSDFRSVLRDKANKYFWTLNTYSDQKKIPQHFRTPWIKQKDKQRNSSLYHLPHPMKVCVVIVRWNPFWLLNFLYVQKSA